MSRTLLAHLTPRAGVSDAPVRVSRVRSYARRMQRTLVLVLVLGASSAHADRDPWRATKVSVGLTAVGGVVALPLLFVESSPARNVVLASAVTAFAVGPSVGHLYAGELWNRGLPMRLGGAALVTAGLAWEKEDPGGSSLGACLFTAGYLTYFAGVYVELRSIRAHVSTLNDQRYTIGISKLSIVPTGRGLSLSGAW